MPFLDGISFQTACSLQQYNYSSYVVDCVGSNHWLVGSALHLYEFPIDTIFTDNFGLGFELRQAYLSFSMLPSGLPPNHA